MIEKSRGRKILPSPITFVRAHRVLVRLAAACCVLLLLGAEPASLARFEKAAETSELLSREQWTVLDRTTDHSLEFLAKRQRPDGSFEAPDIGQPAITSLCVLAFLSRGHTPTEGTYGAALDRAIEYVLRHQRESGLFCVLDLNRSREGDKPHEAATYNHSISGLMLAEIYGMSAQEQRDRIRAAILKAIRFTEQLQRVPKRAPRDEGGWRYIGSTAMRNNDSDLSVTAWHLMFLRSARNAEFEVPKEPIDDAMKFVRSLFRAKQGTFTYTHKANNSELSRGMAGSGILLLSFGGDHRSEMALAAGNWILKHPFDKYNRFEVVNDRYHYSAYYCSQAMFQLGGRYWSEFYPRLMETLLRHQHADGSWDPEANQDHHFGNVYTTALVVLALTPPYQLLPIYQR